MRDPLTGAWQKKEWARIVHEASSRAAERGRGTWVALVDVDHLKRFNVHNGYATGDQVLVDLARFLLSLEGDEGTQVVRTGGDEFALVWLQSATGDAHDRRATCERVLKWARDSLTPEQQRHCGDKHCLGPTRLTLSMALGTIGPGEDAAALHERLDTAMLEAKRTGRDRVLFA